VRQRRALIVGIDFYENQPKLKGCVSDAQNVWRVLCRDEPGSVKNFDCIVKVAKDKDTSITCSALRKSIEDLFNYNGEAVLLYFAGHGHIDAGDSYLIPSDSHTGNDGLSLNFVLNLAHKSKARNKIIVLDSCFSGAAAADVLKPDTSLISDGMTILTASTAEQYASETGTGGLFTHLFVDALEGAASDLIGRITPGGIYAHVDQSLGDWEQRPVFKTNISRFFSFRSVQPKLSIEQLLRLTTLFPEPTSIFELDPTYEPEMKGRDQDMPLPVLAHTEIFALLQRFNRHGLVVPVGVEHMWNAAMQSTGCELTALGRHYRRLVANDLI
jgi:hypothetical protein